jgi:hypothetical protein
VCACVRPRRPGAGTLQSREETARFHLKVDFDVLGYGTVGLTLDTYLHVLPALHQRVASAIDAILAG